MNQEFQDELQKLFDPRLRQQQKTTQKENQSVTPKDGLMDFGFGKSEPYNPLYVSQGIIVF